MSAPRTVILLVSLTLQGPWESNVFGFWGTLGHNSPPDRAGESMKTSHVAEFRIRSHKQKIGTFALETCLASQRLYGDITLPRKI